MIMRVKELADFAKKRHTIYIAKAAGQPKPWTTDNILDRYRFCNVYRELDTVTQWIRMNWRDKHSTDPNLFFAMLVSRLVNWPDTMAELGYPTSFDGEKFVNVINSRVARSEKAYSGAYVVSTNGHAMNKAKYLSQFVLSPVWARRAQIAPQKHDTLATFHSRLMRYDGLGSFIAAQVVCDTKYAAKSPLSKAEDWDTWAASGPGSRRGLNRVIGLDKDSPWREPTWLAKMGELRPQFLKLWPKQWEIVSMQDLQNCLCEFDKYERTRLGEGKPRSGYPGQR